MTFEDYDVLGKRIVLSILKTSGFDVLDYGHGVQADESVSKGGLKQLNSNVVTEAHLF